MLFTILSDEYEEDIKACEEYTDKTKRAVQKASRLWTTIFQPPLHDWVSMGHLSQLQPSLLVRSDIRWSFPPSNLSPLTVMWRLGLDFGSSSDPPLTKTLHFRLNKHVFLRGYLEGETKMLVDGITVTATTYEETKRIVLARYGNTSRIIQAT